MFPGGRVYRCSIRRMGRDAAGLGGLLALAPRGSDATLGEHSPRNGRNLDAHRSQLPPQPFHSKL